MAIFERSPGQSSFIDVLDRVLDKGIVIDGRARVSLAGIDLMPLPVGDGDVTVNALHVTLTNPLTGKATDLIVAQAHADIHCAQSAVGCGAKDFVTGGGWITSTPSGARANFAVAGGDNGWGHLLYIDHGTGTRVKGTGVTKYVVTGETSRHIEGTAEINGGNGTYAADVADNGEPGRGRDIFTLTLSTGYTAGGAIEGGNIQLHCK